MSQSNTRVAHCVVPLDGQGMFFFDPKDKNDVIKMVFFFSKEPNKQIPKLLLKNLPICIKTGGKTTFFFQVVSAIRSAFVSTYENRSM